jgi:hypothetical protein
LVTSCVGSAL